MIKIFLSRFRIDELKLHLGNQFQIFQNDLHQNKLTPEQVKKKFDDFKFRTGNYLLKAAISYGTEVDLGTNVESEINYLLLKFEELVEERIRQLENSVEHEKPELQPIEG